MRKDPASLIRILNDYSSGKVSSLEMLASRHFVSVRSLFLWMRDKTMLVNFAGQEGITFGRAMQLARNMTKIVIVNRSLEAYVAEGRMEEVWFQGRPTYLEDEGLVLLGEEFVQDVLGLPDLYKRDKDGNRIIMTRRVFAPATLIEKYAAANMPGLYGDKREINMRGNVNLGVTTIGTQPPIPLEVQQRLAAAEAITQTVKVSPPAEEPEQFEAEADDTIIGSTVPIMSVVPAAPKPMAFDEVPDRKPRNELEADLFAKLKAAREKAAEKS